MSRIWLASGERQLVRSDEVATSRAALAEGAMPPSSSNRAPHASYVIKGQKWSERPGCKYEAVVPNDACQCDFIGETWAVSKTERAKSLY